MYTYKLGGMLITDELYHDDLEAMTFGRKDQNELRHSGIKGMSWGKRRFQNEDGSLTAAGRNRYGVGDPLKGVSAYSDTGGRGGSGVSYTRLSGGSGGSTNSPNKFGGASGGGGSVMRKSAPTIQWSTPGKDPFSSEGPGQSAGRTVTNKVKAKVNDTVNSGRKAADSLFGSIGNAIKPVTDAVGKATEFVTGANANRRVADAQKAYDDASRHMLVDNRSNVIGTKGANAEHDAEDWQQLADIERARAKAYDISANNRGLFDFGGKEADRHNRDMYENEAREYANKANDLRVQAQKEYADDYRKLEEADRNLRAAEKARDENTLGGVVGNAAKDAGNWLGNAFNDAKNWVGDRAQDVGNVATNAYNDVSKAAGDAVNWVGDRAKDVGNAAVNAYKDASNFVDENITGNSDRSLAKSLNMVADAFPNSDTSSVRRSAEESQAKADNSLFGRIGNAAKDVGDWASNAASDVRDWGAGALDKGRQAFENLFGRSEPAENTIPEQRIEEQRIPEQRIEEQIIPEQRLTENRIKEQKIPETIVREGEKYAQMTPDQRQSRMDSQKNRPTVNGSNNVQTWDNANINTWDNVQTFGDPDMVNTIKMLNDNGFFNRGGSSNSGNNSSMSDKPSNVSDEYWRDYTSNGGTRESYEREMNSRRNSQNNQNSSASRQEVVGTVDTSRPYHFTYDPASGQTIVVYDDDKRR